MGMLRACDFRMAIVTVLYFGALTVTELSGEQFRTYHENIPSLGKTGKQLAPVCHLANS
jgi:predicted oxidoreductase (fatty acid repression mutant protein)